MSKYKYIEIRQWGGRVVQRFDVTDKSERHIDKLDNGININLDHERYATFEKEYDTPQPEKQ